MRVFRYAAVLASMIVVGVASSMATLAALSKDAADANPDMSYARVQMELARLGLKRVERMNKRVEGAVAATVVDEYRSDLDAAARLLEGVRHRDPQAQFEYWLDQVQAASKSAQTEWRIALAANRRAAGAVDAIDLERRRLRSELFAVLLAKGEQAATRPLADRLAWQNEVLLAHVQHLHEEVFRNRSVSGHYYHYNLPYGWE